MHFMHIFSEIIAAENGLAGRFRQTRGWQALPGVLKNSARRKSVLDHRSHKDWKRRRRHQFYGWMCFQRTDVLSTLEEDHPRDAPPSCAGPPLESNQMLNLRRWPRDAHPAYEE